MIASGPFLQYRSFLTPPLLHAGPSIAKNFWTLVERMMGYLKKNEFQCEPLLNELDGIRDGSVASLQTACLAISVGVESLVDILLDKNEVQKPVDELEATDALLDLIDKWEGNKDLKGRAKTLIGSLRSPRAVDALYCFANRKKIDHRLVRAWKSVRDRKAHGKSPVAGQTLQDQYYAVVELFYRLVADAVGYDGLIAQTSERGWGRG